MVDDSDGRMGNWTNLEQEGILSTETDHSEVISSGPNPVLTEKSLSADISTLITSVAHDALAYGLKILGDVWVGENSWNEEFE